jgi:hypothetical protein
MHGRGEYYWGDGHKYVGEYQNGKQHGQGVYTWPTGGQYSGSWKDDRMNGEGIYTRRDGVVYVGKWKNDLQYGMGLKIVPERVCWGPKKLMTRKTIYREIWNGNHQRVFHKEIKLYPDVWNVWKISKFLDVDFIFNSEAADEERGSRVTFEDVADRVRH